jgi:hypothetical protein
MGMENPINSLIANQTSAEDDIHITSGIIAFPWQTKQNETLCILNDRERFNPSYFKLRGVFNDEPFSWRPVC